MGKKELEQVRYMCEMNFRHTLYKNVNFKYFPSIGIRDIFQSYSNKDLYVGVIHLNYRKGETGKMYWHSSWISKPEDAIAKALEIQQGKIYYDQMLINAVERHIQDLYNPPEFFS